MTKDKHQYQLMPVMDVFGYGIYNEEYFYISWKRMLFRITFAYSMIPSKTRRK